MAAVAKTIVATGVSSGLGFEAVKQILAKSQPYNIILGARNVSGTQAAYNAVPRGSKEHSLDVIPLELSDLKTVKSFAQQTLARLGSTKVDYLFLNAAISEGAEKLGPNGSKWCESLVVNHISQHYLVHLLREKLVSSQSRIIFVSSGAVRRVEDTSLLDADLKGGSGTPGTTIYSESKFVQLLGAQWWRRQLLGSCPVVAVSPGLIPNTGITRGSKLKLTMDMPDAKTVDVGAASLLSAFYRDDLPDDPERMFLTSWGEWWEKSVYEKVLDKDLQGKWCPSREQVEKENDL